MIALLVVVFIILIFIIYIHQPNRVHIQKCGCPKCRMADMPSKRFDMHMNEKSDRPKSMWDQEQDVYSRGAITNKNQPNHTENFWKCDYSHARYADGTGCLDTVFAADYPTPLRLGMMNQDVKGNMRSHMISRFGSEKN